MAKESISRCEALKRLAKFTVGVVGFTMLPRIEADAQYYYKYYNYYNSGYGSSGYTKYYNYYGNYYNYSKLLEKNLIIKYNNYTYCVFRVCKKT